MQQVSAGSGLQGSQAQGSVSSQSTRSIGEPPNSSRTVASRPKKRERSDATCDFVKQQRTERGRRCGEEKDSTWKPEASSLVGKDGGISCVASVDRLVCIMQYEWNDNAERQLDLIASRTMLAKVVATTSDRDCLVKFLRLGGLAILDKWLQEAHRGRHFANKEIPVDGEKAVEDLLLALLGALEKLPVDLVTLKTCLVGKSVNLLRSHKHSDIQRRSKKLVEVWKKRVESEMKESGEGRLSVDPALCMQHQEGGMMASKIQLPCYPENPIRHDDLGVGRGKFASVASLCSSQEGLMKASSTLVSFPSVTDASGILPSKVPPTTHVPANGVLSKSPLRLPTSPSLSSEDGQAKSSVNVVSNVACAQVTCNQVRGVKGTGATRSRRSTNVSNIKTAAFSGSVVASKDSSASGSKEVNGVAAHSVVTVPCCSSSQQNPQSSPGYDGSTRSSINSVSSCATDGNKRSTIQPYLSAEPVKAGVQLAANVAASESSMIDVKGPDSPSNKSVSMQRAVPTPTDHSIHLESSRKWSNQFLMKTAGRPQDGEHYDQISSTVSSPSETSVHVDIRMCESKQTLPVYTNALSPLDTTSETSLPSPTTRRNAITASGVLACAQVDQDRVQAVSENIRRVCLQPVLAAETVGESIVADKVENGDITNATLKSALETSTLKGGLQGRASPLKHGKGDPFKAASRQVLAESHQEVRNSQVGISGRGTSERICSPISERSADANLKDGSWKTPSASEEMAPTKGGVNQRPDFDLNEMFSSEEGALQTSATSPNVNMPAQNSFVPASALKPTLPVAPMAPIAVVAAAKGPFILPSASYLPKGDLGWKGSAATSAFRPTQPRHSLQKTNFNVAEQSMNAKVFRDFDLNVAADPVSMDHSEGLSASSVAATFPGRQASSAANIGDSVFSQRSNRMGAGLDLNQVDGGAGESQNRRDFDLNSGPMLQDSDEVVLAGKHHGMRAPFIPENTNSGAPSKLPSHPPNSATPIMMPAFSMPNSEFPYPMGAAAPWFNSGHHDGLLQYNIVMQNQPGMACPPPLPSMPTGLYGGVPFGFSPASMQGFSAPFMDVLRGQHIGASSSSTMSASDEQPMLSSQGKTPSYMMGILGDTIQQHQGNGGFWSRSNLDLNAGPDGIDVKNVKDDRRHMLIMNEQMRARHQVMDMAAVLQQREHEGCPSMPGSIPGPALKQQVWR